MAFNTARGANTEIRVDLLKHLAVGDEDLAILEHLAVGIPSGFDCLVTPSGLWPINPHPRREYNQCKNLEIFDDNYLSFNDDPNVDRIMNKYLEKGIIAPTDKHNLKCAAVLGAVDEGKTDDNGLPVPRIVVDFTKSGFNFRSGFFERQEMSTPKDVGGSLSFMNTASGRRVISLVFDFSGAFAQIGIRGQDQYFFGALWRGKWFRFKRCPFGWVQSSYWFGRAVALVIRCLKKLLMSCCISPHACLIYVDDGLILIDIRDEKVLPVILIFLLISGLLLSWPKVKISIEGFVFGGVGYDLTPPCSLYIHS